MTLTWEQLRHSVLQETGVAFGPRLGVYQASTRSTTAVTIPSLINGAWTGEETVQTTLFLPDASSASDRERPAGTIDPATGIIQNVGNIWSGADGSAAQVEIFRWLTPHEYFNLAVGVFRELDQTILHPLGAFEDADVEASTAAAWTAYLSAVPSKVTDPVLTGRRALLVALSGAGGGARSPVIPVQPQAEIYLSGTALPSTGTAVLELYDVSNSRTIEQTSYAGDRWGHLVIETKTPAGCTEVEVRALGSGAADQIYWDHFSGPWMPDHDLNIYAPSWLDSPHRFRKLREAIYPGGVASRVTDARSRVFRDMRLKEQVSFNVMPSDVNPYVIQLRQSPPKADLWVEGLRSSYDMLSATPANTLSDETIETDLNDNYIIYKVSLAVCDYILSNVDPGNAVVKLNGGRIAALISDYEMTREVELPLQAQEYFPHGLGARV